MGIWEYRGKGYGEYGMERGWYGDTGYGNSGHRAALVTFNVLQLVLCADVITFCFR